MFWQITIAIYILFTNISEFCFVKIYSRIKFDLTNKILMHVYVIEGWHYGTNNQNQKKKIQSAATKDITPQVLSISNIIPVRFSKYRDRFKIFRTQYIKNEIKKMLVQHTLFI